MGFSYFIRDTPVHTLTFNVIFNGTEEVQMGLIQDTISKQADHFNVENKDMMFIGQQLVYLGGGMENFPINISDYLIQNFVQTTESPGTPWNSLTMHYLQILKIPYFKRVLNSLIPLFCVILQEFKIASTKFLFLFHIA